MEGEKKDKEKPTESPTSDSAGGAAGADDEDESTVGNFVSGLLSKLKITKNDSTEEVTKVLEEASLDGIRKYFDSGKCKNVIVLAGAGISTSAGIPDFRSPGSGLYDNIKVKYDLADPQAIFEINFFKRNPKPFYALAKELFPEGYSPTASHHFVKLLHDKGVLLRHYTQNIDGLERKAGVPGGKVIEAHGTFYTSHCLNCKKIYDLPWMREKIMKDEVPLCDCKGIIRPDIVFFGEALPERFFHCISEDFEKADLLIVMGTSLNVQPFASLLDRVNENCPRILINREKVGSGDKTLVAQLMRRFGIDSLEGILGSGGFDFDGPRHRDVPVIGDCDDGCKKLAQILGWENNLQTLIANSNKL